jgi:hypothetical protein
MAMKPMLAFVIAVSASVAGATDWPGYLGGNGAFTLLLYPDGVVAQDPTGVLPKAVMDRDGYVFFRNRWRDEDDIQVALLNPVRRSGGWAQDEYLNLRLSAFDTRFFGGPGKERDAAFYTTLLVDGKHAPAKGGGFVPGRIAVFERDDNGGYVVADASDYYRGLGVTGAVRHLLVRYSKPEENTAIIATLDRVDGDAARTLTWQANLGPEGVEAAAGAGEDSGAEAGSESDPKSKLPDPLAATRAPAEGSVALDAADGPKPAAAAGAGPAPAARKPNDDGILSSRGTEAGRPFFLLKGRRGAVKGWVLHPADAVIETGDPLRVTTRAAKADVWIVLFVGAGDPPVASITGDGVRTELQLAGRKVMFDGERIRCD